MPYWPAHDLAGATVMVIGIGSIGGKSLPRMRSPHMASADSSLSTMTGCDGATWFATSAAPPRSVA